MELHGFIHVGDKLDHVTKLGFLHLPLQFMSFFTTCLSHPAAIPTGFVFPIKVFFAVGCFPAIQDRAQFPLRIPNRDFSPWSPDPQTFERTEALSNLRLDPLARTPRILYPARRDIRPVLQVATNGGTCA